MPSIKDPSWQFWGVVVGVVTLLVTIILAYAQRQRRGIICEVGPCTSVVSVKGEIQGLVQVLFNGDPIHNVQLIIVKITNSGNVPIRVDEFEYPIEIFMGDNCRLLNVEVIEVRPVSLRPILHVNSDSIEINPILLNSKDSIKIKILVSDPAPSINVYARVVHITDIKVVDASKTYYDKLYMYGMLPVAIGGLVATPIFFLSDPNIPLIIIVAVCSAIMVIGLMVALYSLIQDARRVFSKKN